MLGAAMEEEGPRAAAAQRFLELLSFQPLGHLHLAQALLLAHVDPASSLSLVFLPPPGFVLLPGQSLPLVPTLLLYSLYAVPSGGQGLPTRSISMEPMPTELFSVHGVTSTLISILGLWREERNNGLGRHKKEFSQR